MEAFVFIPWTPCAFATQEGRITKHFRPRHCRFAYFRSEDDETMPCLNSRHADQGRREGIGIESNAGDYLENILTHLQCVMTLSTGRRARKFA